MPDASQDAEIAGSLIAEHRTTVDQFAKAIPALLKIKEGLVTLVKRDGRLLICGNGGSAADSQHWAAEWRIRFKDNGRRALRAEALTTDTSSLTAAGNDLGFENVFSRQIEAVGRKGDMLVALSTSGNSKNIIRAVEAAKAAGMTVVGLAGGNGGELAKRADIALVIPSSSTARIQEMHELAMHILCELTDRDILAGAA